MPDYSVGPDAPVELPDPVLERPVGGWLPYRGYVDHGVAVDDHETEAYATEENGYWEGRPVPYEEPAKPGADPVPVRIVNDAPNEMKRFRVSRTQATTSGNQLLGRNPRRNSVRLRNMDAANILYIHHEPNYTSWLGYPILPGTDLEIQGGEPLYAVAATANIEVAVLENVSYPWEEKNL
jgi:hypothetical protein